MKNYQEIQNYFNSLTTEELLQYYNELKTIQDTNNFVIVKKVIEYCYDKVDNIWVQINRLHWYFAESLINKLSN